MENPDDTTASSGLAADYAGLIKNTFDALSSDESLSYFAYEKMEMYVYGGDPESDNCDWCNTDSSEVDLLFRFGKDVYDNYYEIRQTIYKGWDERNHIAINIDNLTQLKIPLIDALPEILADVGIDGCSAATENGLGGCLGIDTLFSDLCESVPDVCNLGCEGDPNCDNLSQENETGTEGNGSWDEGEPAEVDYDGNGVYTPELNYDDEKELYYWDQAADLSPICNNCTRLHCNVH